MKPAVPSERQRAKNLALVLSSALVVIVLLYLWLFAALHTSTNGAGGRRLAPTSVARKARISFSTTREEIFNSTFGTSCPVNRPRTWMDRNLVRRPLSRNMKELLEFSTKISTNLKIIFLGDSVAMQFKNSLEEAAGVTFDVRHIYRTVEGKDAESIAVSGPVRGGGVLAGFRITGQLSKSGRGQPLPNNPGGGWRLADVRSVLNHTYGPNKKRVEQFDAVIYRIPHAWIELSEITRDSVRESIELAHELFGVSTVILTTSYIHNNVKTAEHLRDLTRTNAMLRDLATKWQSDGGVDTVLVLEFGRWTSQVQEANARAIGMNMSDPLFALQSLGCTFPPSYSPHIANVCATLVQNGECDNWCELNRLSRDGLHWCMESISGRFNAGVACLLGCAYNWPEKSLRQCETRCNDRFMSMAPVVMTDVEMKPGSAGN